MNYDRKIYLNNKESINTFAGAVLGGAALAVMRLLARSLLCLSRGAAARGNGFGALVLQK